MPDQMIVQYCSPTLAGLKTGNMFSVRFASNEEMIREIRALNRVLKEKDLRAIPFRQKGGRYLVYIYRPAFLKEDLANPAALAILLEKGYRTGSTEGCLAQLACRVERNNVFPHEIGLFLGYPPADVKAFMKHPNDGVKKAGYWKAYGNAEEAESVFRMYRTCTELYLQEVSRGRTIRNLAVRTDRKKKL